MGNPVIAGFISGLSLGIKTCLIVFTFVWVRAGGLGIHLVRYNYQTPGTLKIWLLRP